MSLKQFLDMGHSIKDLTPVNLNLNAANKSVIKIDGAFFGEITGIDRHGSVICHKSMVYVSRDVAGFYISYDTMLELGMISIGFPNPGCVLSLEQTIVPTQ